MMLFAGFSRRLCNWLGLHVCGIYGKALTLPEFRGSRLPRKGPGVSGLPGISNADQFSLTSAQRVFVSVDFISSCPEATSAVTLQTEIIASSQKMRRSKTKSAE